MKCKKQKKRGELPASLDDPEALEKANREFLRLLREEAERSQHSDKKKGGG